MYLVLPEMLDDDYFARWQMCIRREQSKAGYARPAVLQAVVGTRINLTCQWTVPPRFVHVVCL